MTKYSYHIFAVSFLFVLGGSIITLPFLKFNFIVHVICSGVLCLAFMCAVYLILLFANQFKIIYYCLLLVLCFIAIRSSLNALSDFGQFLKAVQMPHTSNALLTIALIGTVIPFTLSKTSAFYKYSLLCGALCVLIIALGALLNIKYFDLSVNLINFKFKAFSVTSFLNCFSHVFLLPLFVLKVNGFHSIKSAFGGVAFGFVLLLLCSITCVLTLGQNAIDYPYIKAVGIISSGSLFTRIDGLFYFLFFVTSTTQITVCIKTLLYVIKTHLKIKANAL